MHEAFECSRGKRSHNLPRRLSRPSMGSNYRGLTGVTTSLCSFQL